MKAYRCISGCWRRKDFMETDDMTENELKLKTEEAVLRPTIGEQMCRKLDLAIHLLTDIRKNTRQTTGVNRLNNVNTIK